MANVAFTKLYGWLMKQLFRGTIDQSLDTLEKGLGTDLSYDESDSDKATDKAFGDSGLDNTILGSLGFPSNSSDLFGISSFFNQFTGRHLTGAQSEQNQFNAEQSAIQRGWEERMSNTSYQRAVADMQSAGLNPALMYGSGASGATTPSGSAASGVAVASQASALLDIFMNKLNLDMQDKMSKRQSDTSIKTAEIQAEAAVKIAEIQERWQNRGQDIHNLDSMRNYITNLQHNSNELLRIQNELRETFAKIGLINAEKLAQEAAARLSNASAAHTSKMSQVLYDAQWINNEELSAQHLFNNVKRAYDGGLLTDEQLESAYDTALKQGVITSSEASRAEFLEAVREGKAFKGWMYAPLNFALRIINAWSSVLGLNVGLGANASKVSKVP